MPSYTCKIVIEEFHISSDDENSVPFHTTERYFQLQFTLMNSDNLTIHS